jgi:hypothetical protein
VSNFAQNIFLSFGGRASNAAAKANAGVLRFAQNDSRNRQRQVQPQVLRLRCSQSAVSNFAQNMFLSFGGRANNATANANAGVLRFAQNDSRNKQWQVQPRSFDCVAHKVPWATSLKMTEFFEFWKKNRQQQKATATATTKANANAGVLRFAQNDRLLCARNASRWRHCQPGNVLRSIYG